MRRDCEPIHEDEDDRRLIDDPIHAGELSRVVIDHTGQHPLSDGDDPYSAWRISDARTDDCGRRHGDVAASDRGTDTRRAGSRDRLQADNVAETATA